MADQVRKEALEKLPLLSLEQLLEIADRITITITDAKKTNRKAVSNAIARHLLSEALEDLEDEGLSVCTRVLDEAKVMLEGTDDKTKVKQETKTTDSTAESEESKPVVDLRRIREFKITGGVVAGKQNPLDYGSLCRQIQDGKELKYSTKEIVSGVIKGMKPGSSARKYFEGIVGLTEEGMMKTLRSIYNVKESTLLLDEMVNSSQEPTETEMDYCMRMLGLKNEIITVTKEEECPLGEDLVRRRCLYAISVGLRKDTIRLELQNLLKDSKIGDQILLDEVAKVMTKDQDNRKKTKGGKSLSSNALNVEESSKGSESRGNQDIQGNEILAAVKQISANMQEEMKDLRKQVADLSKKETGKKTNWRVGFIKCEACEAAKKFCNHCSVCGEGGHKRKDCTKNE